MASVRRERVLQGIRFNFEFLIVDESTVFVILLALDTKNQIQLVVGLAGPD